ncbi:MAG: hypothetical protein QOD75_2770 [Blastocatellia bacterium]|jgi:hypothetical protein|nr:hypothetical protein [Blastocatellia bacterium]
MSKRSKPLLVVGVLIVVLGCMTSGHGQGMDVPGNPSGEASRIPRSSRTNRVLLHIADALIQVYCRETGRCPSSTNSSSEPVESTPKAFDTNAYPRLSRSPSSDLNQPSTHLNFSFVAPLGWQRFDDIGSVTLAPSSQYSGGSLTNGVILGLFDFSSSTFEKGAEKHLQELKSANKYLKRIGGPVSETVDGVPCVTNRLAGVSPKSSYTEQVVVYACKRSPIKLFYLITVNSGPNAAQYEEQNIGISRSITFLK